MATPIAAVFEAYCAARVFLEDREVRPLFRKEKQTLAGIAYECTQAWTRNRFEMHGGKVTPFIDINNEPCDGYNLDWVKGYITYCNKHYSNYAALYAELEETRASSSKATQQATRQEAE